MAVCFDEQSKTWLCNGEISLGIREGRCWFCDPPPHLRISQTLGTEALDRKARDMTNHFPRPRFSSQLKTSMYHAATMIVLSRDYGENEMMPREVCLRRAMSGRSWINAPRRIEIHHRPAEYKHAAESITPCSGALLRCCMHGTDLNTASSLSCDMESQHTGLLCSQVSIHRFTGFVARFRLA